MNFKDWRRRKKLNVKVLQPHLPVRGSEISALLRQVISLHFPEMTSPGVFFGRTPTLAHIENAQSEGESSIWIHNALNDPATPEYVFSFVLKHELLHRRIHPREIEGKWLAHPPEFWDAEARIAHSERSRAWQWIYANFGEALQKDCEHECIWVNNTRMKRLLHNRHFTEQDLAHLYSACKLRPKELRFGFREQAVRDFDVKRNRSAELLL